jgi:protein SCO1
MSGDIPRMPRLGWVAVFIALAGLIAWAAFSVQRMKAQSTLEQYGPAPEFHLTAQDGTVVSPATLKGKVWVADFIFTRCPGPCPIMTGHMAELNRQLGDEKDVELVSFTVDPEFDTPGVLKTYGESYGASPQRWKFLTGPLEQIKDVTIKGFLQALNKGSDGLPMHSTRFILVDRNGQIRGFQDSSDPKLIEKLLANIKTLLHEPAPQ